MKSDNGFKTYKQTYPHILYQYVKIITTIKNEPLHVAPNPQSGGYFTDFVPESFHCLDSVPELNHSISRLCATNVVNVLL